MNPEPHVGKRIVVVGRGNSAVQVGYELSAVAEVTLATRAPVQFLDQVHGGRDLHYWLTTTGFDDIPPQWLAQIVAGTLVLDAGDYREALKSGRLEQRLMFAALDHDRVIWTDGAAESVDLVLLATGYRPRVDYLEGLGALDPDGAPLHSSGVSNTHPGLVYLGLELQRSFASNTLRGVARDAAFVIRPLAAHVRGAPAAVGL
jgi:putative flavoprotein involved in K+ transport